MSWRQPHAWRIDNLNARCITLKTSTLIFHIWTHRSQRLLVTIIPNRLLHTLVTFNRWRIGVPSHFVFLHHSEHIEQIHPRRCQQDVYIRVFTISHQARPLPSSGITQTSETTFNNLLASNIVRPIQSNRSSQNYRDHQILVLSCTRRVVSVQSLCSSGMTRIYLS